MDKTRQNGDLELAAGEMTTLKRTKLIVATGILVCLMGLSFIAVSGHPALSEGYGSEFNLSSLSPWYNVQSGQCIAQKGSQTCEPVRL
ncbi:hypothetical protein [uncultured Cohaesibacter sp.]|uniref:hypothetical protein n=1 Tax=uncultured Cohaesibacter sp. TaxID=1002546 RepID=UPI002A0A76EC|nr:hypothetical protein [uncultured Cohaesibacter sp.]